MNKARYIAKMGLLLALACSLQFLESLIPISLPLGIKVGISSVVVMYVIIAMGFAPAMTVAVLKSVFVFATRGASAFCMSLCGGIISVVAMEIYFILSGHGKGGTGILMLSVTGGVFHNIGQLLAASLIAKSVATLTYLPILVIAGIVSGTITGIILKLLLKGVHIHNEKIERDKTQTP